MSCTPFIMSLPLLMNRRIRVIINLSLVLSLMLLGLTGLSTAQEGKKPGAGRGNQSSTYLSDIPDYPGNIILARPTERSVTANVIIHRPARIRIQFGILGQIEHQTDIVELKPGVPRDIILDKLQPDSQYEYRVIDADSRVTLLTETGKGSFHTQRSQGSAFTFTVQADSHLDENCQADIYQRTLLNVRNEHPDFHIDLGDTFMTGKIIDRQNALKQYLAQRYYFGLVGYASHLFMVLGNHDGEETPKNRRDTVDNLADWACLQRETYFSNPVPDTFYSGNTTVKPGIGLLQDYYSFEWGDALFVVLDPYWYSSGNKGGTAPWNMTLGKTQYDWLEKTLHRSKSKFKFVFIHQLVGGLDSAGRGGAEAASLFEWGGHELDGRDTYSSNRPGWEKPIHQLLVETSVTIVFHGHDHFFAKQELDGVIYQLVPQPGHRNFRNPQADEYGYKTGTFLPNSGHLRVQVSSDQVLVDYIRTSIPSMPLQGIKNGDISCTYLCHAPVSSHKTKR